MRWVGRPRRFVAMPVEVCASSAEAFPDYIRPTIDASKEVLRDGTVEHIVVRSRDGSIQAPIDPSRHSPSTHLGGAVLLDILPALKDRDSYC